MSQLAKNSLFAVLGIALGFLGAFAAGEAALRLIHHEWRDRDNALEKFVRRSRADCLTDFDPHLGWVTRSHAAPQPNNYRTIVSSGEDGLRNSGNTPVPAAGAPALLAVGDSFTFGDEVNDSESWPAYLQRLTPDRVLNAGVCGYGVDQILLRMESLLPKYRPHWIVFSIFALDIGRNELVAYPDIHRQIEKPYFVLEKTGLVLKNATVPRTDEPPLELGPIREILGYSHLASALMVRLAPHYWFAPLSRPPAQLSGQNGLALTCALMQRLQEQVRQSGSRVLVLAQYGPHTETKLRDTMQAMVACAGQAGLTVLDLLPIFDQLEKTDPRTYRSLFGAGHMSALGNRFVAQRLQRALATGR